MCLWRGLSSAVMFHHVCISQSIVSTPRSVRQHAPPCCSSTVRSAVVCTLKSESPAAWIWSITALVIGAVFTDDFMLMSDLCYFYKRNYFLSSEFWILGSLRGLCLWNGTDMELVCHIWAAQGEQMWRSLFFFLNWLPCHKHKSVAMVPSKEESLTRVPYIFKPLIGIASKVAPPAALPFSCCTATLVSGPGSLEEAAAAGRLRLQSLIGARGRLPLLLQLCCRWLTAGSKPCD